MWILEVGFWPWIDHLSKLDRDEAKQVEGSVWLAFPTKCQQKSTIEGVPKFYQWIDHFSKTTQSHNDLKSVDLYKLFLLKCDFLEFSLGVVLSKNGGKGSKL